MNENNLLNNVESGVVDTQTRLVLIPCDGVVLFPGQTLSFTVSESSVVRSLMYAVENNGDIFVSYSTQVAPENVSRVGTVAKIKQLIKNVNGGLNVIVHGEKRMRIASFVDCLPLEVILEEYNSIDEDKSIIDATVEVTRETLMKAREVGLKIVEKELSDVTLPEFFGEASIAFYANISEKQALLEERSLSEQYIDVCKHVEKKLEIKAIKKSIDLKVHKSLDKNQRDYYLREQIKAMHSELGDDVDELDDYRERLDAKCLPDNVRAKAEKELSKFGKMPPTSPESAVCRGYLDLVLELPWEEETKDEIDVSFARKTLDEDHFGLEKVKQRIIEYLAVCALKKDMKAPILCFVGPPGVGKTSIVKSIARAVKRKFVSISLGGVKDEAEIRGHRKTYIGSMPGRIIAGLQDVGVINPVFLLDEIDKMSADFRGDPSSALLEVLDSNQNSSFKDHYLEVPYDLSKVMFITTANSVESIDPPLLDRMEVIELSGYTYNEKLQIAKKYLIPKQCDANGVERNKIKFTDEAIIKIIRAFTAESGVRNLERVIGSVVRKIAVNLAEGKKIIKKTIDEKTVNDLLGKDKYSEPEVQNESVVGCVTGLAWTSIGGTTLDIEATVLSGGKGEVKLTGNLGDIMKESAMTALSLVRARANILGIDSAKFSDCDVHIHVPEGATPKDGPSAGITMATAVASAFSCKQVCCDVAMTGEVTLLGKVLPIGGLKEKSLAAFRCGKKRLLIPCGNKKDLDEIPSEVKNVMEIIPVSTIDEVFSVALI